jgi:hypothetical protein
MRKINLGKKSFRLNYLLFLVLFISIASCGGGDDGPALPTDQELAQEILEATWSLGGGGAITLDGRNVANNYNGFTLNIADGTFTTTNAGDLFPASGTWQWVGETDNQVRTGEGKEITISDLSETTFTFSFTKSSGNSVAGVSGNYVITLKN